MNGAELPSGTCCAVMAILYVRCYSRGDFFAHTGYPPFKMCASDCECCDLRYFNKERAVQTRSLFVSYYWGKTDSDHFLIVNLYVRQENPVGDDMRVSTVPVLFHFRMSFLPSNVHVPLSPFPRWNVPSALSFRLSVQSL